MVRALSTLIRFTARVVVRLVKAALLVALLAGIPYGLLTQIGSPLPRHLPTSDQISHTLTGPVSDTLVLNVLAAALWILWAAFVVSFAVEVVAAVRGVPRPRLGPIAPLQTLAGWLVAGVTAGVLAAAPVMAVAGHAAPAAAVVATTPGQTAPASYSAVNGAHRPPAVTTVNLSLSTVDDRGPVLTAATTTGVRAPATQMPVYEVRHDDWLGVIARAVPRRLRPLPRHPTTQPRPDHRSQPHRTAMAADPARRRLRPRRPHPRHRPPGRQTPGRDQPRSRQPDPTRPANHPTQPGRQRRFGQPRTVGHAQPLGELVPDHQPSPVNDRHRIGSRRWLRPPPAAPGTATRPRTATHPPSSSPRTGTG